MTRINRFVPAFFAAAALSFAVPALAQDASYPRVVGTGENASIDYGNAPMQNMVGGGAVTYTTSPNGNWSIRHMQPSYAQAAPLGQVPVTVGSGESTTTVWIPRQSNSPTLALALGNG